MRWLTALVLVLGASPSVALAQDDPNTKLRKERERFDAVLRNMDYEKPADPFQGSRVDADAIRRALNENVAKLKRMQRTRLGRCRAYLRAHRMKYLGLLGPDAKTPKLTRSLFRICDEEFTSFMFCTRAVDEEDIRPQFERHCFGNPPPRRPPPPEPRAEKKRRDFIDRPVSGLHGTRTRGRRADTRSPEEVEALQAKVDAITKRRNHDFTLEKLMASRGFGENTSKVQRLVRAFAKEHGDGPWEGELLEQLVLDIARIHPLYNFKIGGLFRDGKYGFATSKRKARLHYRKYCKAWCKKYRKRKSLKACLRVDCAIPLE